jgi:hypothetical protein
MGDIVGDINRRKRLMTWDTVLKLLSKRCYQNGYTTLRTFHLVTNYMEFSHCGNPSNISEVIKKAKGNA